MQFIEIDVKNSIDILMKNLFVISYFNETNVVTYEDILVGMLYLYVRIYV